MKSHLFIATSGTTSRASAVKFAALSKKAFLISASAVNGVLGSTQQDIWINPLPEHHVGGLSIYARAHLSGAKVIPLTEKWDPIAFCSFIERNCGTLASLVPTQVFDLVQLSLKAPPSLRHIIVGGGALSKILYDKAQSLGWPLLPSYGMTECSSQIATAQPNSYALKLLPHIRAKTNEAGILMVKSDALLTGYVFLKEGITFWKDPKVDGWLTTEDLVEIKKDEIAVLGRVDDIVKIGAEMVNVKKLEEILAQVCLELNIDIDAALLALPDDRLGHAIHLALSKKNAPYEVQIYNSFCSRVLPFERIRKIHIVDSMPRTSLGKICKKVLEANLKPDLQQDSKRS